MSDICLNDSEVQSLIELLDLVKLPFNDWDKYDNLMKKIYQDEVTDDE